MFSWRSFSLQGGVRLERETLYGLAVNKLDLISGDHVTLRVFTFAVAYLAAFCWLFQVNATRAFASDLQLELNKQQGFGAVFGCEPPGHEAVTVWDGCHRLALVLGG